MKMLNLISGIVVLGFTVSTANAANYKFVLADNSIDSRMCLAAVTNDKESLKHNIHRSGTGVRVVAHNLMCNDQIVANFAYQYGATETFSYLDRYTLKRDKKARPTVTIQDITAVDGKTTVILIASN